MLVLKKATPSLSTAGVKAVIKKQICCTSIEALKSLYGDIAVAFVCESM